MTIGKGWLFIVGLVVGLAVLAPDSKVGGEIRNMWSQLRGAARRLWTQPGAGLRTSAALWGSE